MKSILMVFSLLLSTFSAASDLDNNSSGCENYSPVGFSEVVANDVTINFPNMNDVFYALVAEQLKISNGSRFQSAEAKNLNLKFRRYHDELEIFSPYFFVEFGENVKYSTIRGSITTDAMNPIEYELEATKGSSILNKISECGIKPTLSTEDVVELSGVKLKSAKIKLYLSSDNQLDDSLSGAIKKWAENSKHLSSEDIAKIDSFIMLNKPNLTIKLDFIDPATTMAIYRAYAANGEEMDRILAEHKISYFPTIE